jgi:hypothetical protein
MVLCGFFFGFIALLSNFIGIYQGLWHRFLSTKRGQNVVNCMVNVDKKGRFGSRECIPQGLKPEFCFPERPKAEAFGYLEAKT